MSERIAGGAAAAAAARERLSELLGDATPAETLHDLLLLTTELITNAVRHAAADESETLELDVIANGTVLRVAVTDPGGETSPQVQEQDLTSPGGMGLYLVEQISTRWGVRRAHSGGTQVWFELAQAA